jgi:hypothetical protein
MCVTRVAQDNTYGAAPSGARDLHRFSVPALPGWADVWSRPSGPCGTKGTAEAEAVPFVQREFFPQPV